MRCMHMRTCGACICSTHVASFMLLKGMMPAMVAGSPKYSALTPSLLQMVPRHDTMLPRAGIVSSAIRMRTCTLKQEAASAT